MKIISDLQLHSRFSRACSKYITLDKLEEYARIKGLNLLVTGDFQHPQWNDEIKKTLKEDENGILWSKNKFPFLWGTEISLMYSQEGRRAVHLLVYAPNGEVADQFTDVLGKKGRLDYDGRPIFGMGCPEFVEMTRSISKDIEVVPSHSYTSFFGVFGSKSGFNSLKECFQDTTQHIHAIESGMSADPNMIRLMSDLDKYTILSSSDAHSFHPWRLGREATLFDIKEITSKNILQSIRTGEGVSTIEVDPGYGKYHVDGHRNCNVVLEPEETKKVNGICPKCNKPLTVGVLSRALELADRDEPKNVPEFTSLIPLHELISSVYDIKQLSSKKIGEVYSQLIKNFKNEFNILLNVNKEELEKIVSGKLVNVILKNREGKLNIQAGYDGVYGKVIIEDKDKLQKQKSLGEFV